MARSLRPRFPAAAAIAVLAAGCGFRSPASGVDGPPPSDALTDGVIDGPPAVSCLERWHAGTVTFGAPVQLTELGSPDMDRDPFLTPDERTIYFSTSRGGTQNADVFTATRASLTEPFGAPQRDADISSADYDSRFTMSANELIGIVASNRSGTEGNSDLWISTRVNKSGPFNNFAQAMGLPNINGSGEELDPQITADGLRIYLAIGSPQRIVVSERGEVTSTFSSTRQLDELFSNKGDADPSLSPDERVIVFSSTRGNGDADLFYATRADKDARFSGAARLAISSTANDGDPLLSPDGCRLYFTSDRGGNFDLYVASVTPQ